MHTLKAGALYFALVFAAGFAPGTIRVLWVVPAAGTAYSISPGSASAYSLSRCTIQS
jgi:hypothetical protein